MIAMLSWLPWRQAVVFIFSAEGTIKNVQSRDNANVGHIGHRKKTNKAPKKRRKKTSYTDPNKIRESNPAVLAVPVPIVAPVVVLRHIPTE